MLARWSHQMGSPKKGSYKARIRVMGLYEVCIAKFKRTHMRTSRLEISLILLWSYSPVHEYGLGLIETKLKVISVIL